MANKKSDYCLVLGGGGAKGVFHIGAWRALQELGIPINAFIGNSIGAIVAGFLAQGAGQKLEEISTQVGLDFVLNIPEEFLESGLLKLNPAKITHLKKMYRTTIDKGGLDTTPLRRLLNASLDEDLIRKSGNDLGIVTYSVSDVKPKEIFVEDMEKGHLIDYLMASSAVPGFEKPEIAGKKFIDGGVYDNIPYSMARRRGYRRIIVIDISGIGVTHKPDIEGGETIYIKNSINMGGILDFNRTFLEHYKELGYLDTLRTFEKLKGYHYFLLPKARIENQFNDFILQEHNIEKLTEFVKKYFTKEDLTASLALKQIFPESAQFDKQWLVVFSDCAATILSIDKIRKWEFKELFSEIGKKFDEVYEKVDALSHRDSVHIEKIIQSRLKGKHLTEAPYYYYLLIDRFIPAKAQKLLKKGLFALMPELPAGHFFLSELKEFWEK